jgi:two-component system, NtrC family, response regulator AtoC
MKARVLVVEDDPAMLSWLDEELTEAGYRVTAVSSAAAALARLPEAPVDVVLTDLVMPGTRGDALLRDLRREHPGTPVIIMTAFGSIESAVEAMREGAAHYLTKPFTIAALLDTLDRALGDARRRDAARPLADPAEVGRGIVAHSPGMRHVLDFVGRAAFADTPVLVVGESGTGKELIARALHHAGPRRDRPFLAINCSAIPEALLESQLFGHQKGAFTDAKEARQGWFQEAEGGTIVLDEIGDMSPALQAKLLRVLQEREVHPVGAAFPVPIDVRVIAVTHRDLEALSAEGRFRPDLYYRLNVILIEVPPLRDRPEDLVPLAAHFIAKHAPRLRREPVSLSPDVLELFRGYHWPGNVRELENAIERALVLGRGAVIEVADLPASLRKPASADASRVRSLSETERDEIVKALESVGGNKAAAARLLGLDRKTLYRKLELYRIG